MTLIRLGLTGDLMGPDGRYLFPDYDLDGLEQDPGLERRRVTLAGDGRLPAGALDDLDLLVSVPHGAPLGAGDLAGARALVAVVRVGTGFEDVDVGALTDQGIALVTPAEATAVPTAIATLTLILAVATRLIEKHRLTLAGPAAWEDRAALRGRAVSGRVLGLIGCGRIGRALLPLVAPLGLRPVVCDPALTAAEAVRLGLALAPLEAVLAQADILAVLCPLTPATRHLLNTRTLSLVRPGAILVNAARGGIVDQSALLAALDSGRLAGAGLDVFEREPPDPDDPLLHHPSVVLSAHALNWTVELDRDFGLRNAAALRRLLSGAIPDGIANPQVLDHPAFHARLAALARRYPHPAAPAPAAAQEQALP